MLTGIVEDKELHYENWLYTDFKEPKEDAIVLDIDLQQHPYFALHYYRHLLQEYFKDRADDTRRNFTKELEVWVQSPKEDTCKYKIYFQFTLKVQYCIFW